MSACIFILFFVWRLSYDQVIAFSRTDGTVFLYNGLRLSGERASDAGGFAYYGIKYGQAKRFQHSYLNTDFAYLNDTNRPKKGPVCQQTLYPVLMLLNRQNLTMSEDCLYLDIYLPPENSTHNGSWPILFWIHGGALRSTYQIPSGPLSAIVH